MAHKKLKIVLLLIVIVFLLVSVSYEDDIEFSSNPESPFVFIYQYPNYPLPEQKMISGARFAVWNDGKVVRKEIQDGDIEVWYEGKVDEIVISDIKAKIRQEKLLRLDSEQFVIIDASSESLVIRTSKGIMDWASSPDLNHHSNTNVREMNDYLMKLKLNDEKVIKWDNSYPHAWFEYSKNNNQGK